MILLVCAAPMAVAGDVNFILGNRAFFDDELDPVDEQDLLGVNIDFGDSKVFHWVLGLHTSRGEETPGGPFAGLVSVELSTLELSFGIAKLWEGEKRIRPFIGVGAALIRAEKETDLFGLIERDDAIYLGLYVNGGAFWRFGKRFNLGIDGRYYYTDDEPLSDWDDLQDDVPSLDYVQIGMIVGWGW